VNGDRLEIARIYTGRGWLGKGGPGQSEVRGGAGVLGVKKACGHGGGGGKCISLCTIGVIILKLKLQQHGESLKTRSLCYAIFVSCF
jgi:hypothetical protein